MTLGSALVTYGGEPTEVGPTQVVTVGPTWVDIPTTLDHASPYQFDLGGGLITIYGTQLSGVTQIGFYRPTTQSPDRVEVIVPANASSTQISTNLPSSVANTPGVWWIRVYKNSGNSGWSPLQQSLPIRIGDGPIMCPGTSDAGNYGMLKLARSQADPELVTLRVTIGLCGTLRDRFLHQQNSFEAELGVSEDDVHVHHQVPYA